MKIIKYLFGFTESVGPKSYLFWGFILFIIKYAFEFWLSYHYMGHVLTPIDFLNPLLSSKVKFFGEPLFHLSPIMLYGYSSLIFLWIGVSMTSRRALDANLSPWWVILFFVPALNIFLMLYLSFKPSANNLIEHKSDFTHKATGPLRFLFLYMIVTAILGALVTGILVFVNKSYGNILFIALPFAIGLCFGYFINRKGFLGFKKTLLLALGTMLLSNGFILLFAIEGLMCVLMALPLALLGGTAGALFGAKLSCMNTNQMSGLRAISILPILAVSGYVEKELTPTYHDAIRSEIIINAPIEKVWENVVVFPKLDEPKEWIFRAGISYPISAEIEGSGVGAIRYCKFNAGDFVEPITVWNEPTQLSFDVKFQPKPMQEMTFWDEIEAPHLDGFFASEKGQFKLEKLDDGRTKLIGTTWYKMKIFPSKYWKVYSDWIVHKIHVRVLEHIKKHSEV